MESQIAEPARTAAARSNMLTLSLLLNAILLGWVGYAQLGRYLVGGDGVSLVLSNDTGATLVEPVLEYPGGAFRLPELASGKAVGTSIPAPGRFEATLTFKGAGSETRSHKVVISPLGELLVVLHVLPSPNADDPAEEAGEEAPPAAPGTRVIVAYQGESNNI